MRIISRLNGRRDFLCSRVRENRRDILSVESNWAFNRLKQLVYKGYYLLQERRGRRKKDTRCARLNEPFKKFMRALKLP